MARRTALPVAVLAGLLLAAGASGHGTRATTNVCGNTVSSDLALDADQACTGDGLVVGADGVTIDLAGHTIGGDGGAGDVGVDLAGHAGVTIRNGVIDHFETNLLGSAAGLTIDRIVSRSASHDGAAVGGASLVVTRSSFVGNAGTGLRADGSTTGTIADSYVSVNTDAGLDLRGSLALSRAVVTRNGLDGVDLTQSPAGQTVSIDASTIAGNGTVGVEAKSRALTLTGSTIAGNGSHGVSLESSAGAVVTGSRIAGNDGVGILLLTASSNARLEANRVVGNLLDGIFVSSDSTGAALESNLASGNGGDGIEADPSVVGTGARLAKNTANGNGAFGIHAVAATADLGGNAGRGNLGAADCQVVFCPSPIPAPGAGVDPGCGGQISTSTVLGADLSCNGVDGLDVVADGVTIDLNGHTITGTTGTGIDGEGHRGLKIENGYVRGFATGIVQSFGDLTLNGVDVRGATGPGVSAAGRVTVSASVFADNGGVGVTVTSPKPKVASSVFAGNGSFGLVTSSGAAVAASTAALNTQAGFYVGGGDGKAKLQSLVSARNGRGMFLLPGAGGPKVGNAIVAGNSGDGILLSGSVSTSIKGTASLGNGGNGILVADSSTGGRVDKSVAIGNGADGIDVIASSALTLVSAVTADGNGDDGVDVDGFTTIAKTTMDGNASWGQEGPHGAGGKANHAHANGAGECETIVCA